MTRAAVTKIKKMWRSKRGYAHTSFKREKTLAHRAERRWAKRIVKTETWDDIHKPRLTSWDLD
jgi:hypothetical protein